MPRFPASVASRSPFPVQGQVAERRAEVIAFEREMMAFFTDAAELLGVPKSVAAIYGVIFASPMPIGFAEIEERLELSKGSVSQGLRALREIGAIRICGTPEIVVRSSQIGLEATKASSGRAVRGVNGAEDEDRSSQSGKVPISDLPSPISDRGAARRDLYVPDLEMRKLIQRFLQQRIATQLETGKQRLAGLEAGLGQFTAGDRRVLQARMKKLGRWHTRTRRLLPVVNAFLKIG